jgi:hypothetical protein
VPQAQYEFYCGQEVTVQGVRLLTRRARLGCRRQMRAGQSGALLTQVWNRSPFLIMRCRRQAGAITEPWWLGIIRVERMGRRQKSPGAHVRAVAATVSAGPVGRDHGDGDKVGCLVAGFMLKTPA